MPAIISEWLAINDALAYIDKSLDNVADLDDDLTWTNAEVIEVMRDVRAILAPHWHKNPEALQRVRTLEHARETFEHAMMANGLQGNLYEWVDIHAAIDTYTEAVLAHATTDTPALAVEETTP